MRSSFKKGIRFLTTKSDETNNPWFRVGFDVYITTSLVWNEYWGNDEWWANAPKPSLNL